MKFCTQCGKQLADDAKFCTGCGAKQAQPPQPPAPAQQKSEPVQKKNQDSPRPEKPAKPRRPVNPGLWKRVGLLCGILVLVAGLAFGGYYLYFHTDLLKPPAEEEAVCTVRFNTNGGTKVEKQTVQSGEKPTFPGIPEREGYTFVGWYTSNGYSKLFDFSKPVTKSRTVYARWVDTTDTTDTDGDGLTDPIEEYYGTNINLVDTDGDSLSDYLEIAVFNYDPLNKDSDGNGIWDGEEDADADTLSNQREVELGTNPVLADTDDDELPDAEELNVYGTDPLVRDTDLDGAYDGWEITNGFDPLVYQYTFAVVVTPENPPEDTNISASVWMEANGEQASALKVEEITKEDSLLLTETIPGYLGSAYDFSTHGEIDSAVITFAYDASLGTVSEDFQPRIYYYNEDTHLLEELPGQYVENGMVSVTVTHFSIYVLLNKVAFDEVWESDIKPPEFQGDGMTGIDVVFVVDSSGSMDSNDPNQIRHQAVMQFVEKLGEHDRAAIVDFDSYASVYQDFTADKDALQAAVNRIDSSGGTNLSRGLSAAIDLFTGDSYTRTDALKYVVFLTDGDGSYSSSYTTYAAEQNICVYTIGLGSGVRPAVLEGIARGTGGKYYFATASTNLPDIYGEVSFETIDYIADSNDDNLSDYYTKLIYDGVLVLSNGSRQFAGIDFTYDKDGNPSDDYDGDGVLNGDELIVVRVGNVVYMEMKSDPTKADTDGDGYVDGEDKNPSAWDVSDRDLVMCASMSYSFIPTCASLNLLSDSLLDEIEKRFEDVATVKELERWSVVDTWYAGGGLQAVAFKVDSNIVVAYRGTDEGVDWFNDATTYVLGISTHTAGAKKFMKQVMADYSGYNIYVTGHSLGGHLAYNAAAEGIHYNKAAIKGVVTFNGLGLTLGLTLFGDLWDETQLLKKPEVIRNYSVEGDPVSKGFLGGTTFHYGTTYTYAISSKAPDAHSLYTFMERLDPTWRFEYYE